MIDVKEFIPESFEVVDEEMIEQNLRVLISQKHFRTAWHLVSNNGLSKHYRFYSLGVWLEHHSNQYGDIGELPSECLLKNELEENVQRLLSLL